jgi:hypothetical protein
MANRQLVALGVIFAAFAAASAGAEPAAPAAPKAEKAAAGAEKRADKAEARADKAEAKADKAEARADKAEARADKAEARAGRAEGKGDGPLGDRGEHAGHRHGRFRSGLHLLFADFKDGKIKKEELKDKLAKLRETASQRRHEHRQALKNRWGTALTLPPVREELRHHARRMAFLNRALFLAQTEVAPKDKAKLVERIEKLIDKENDRHERAMERFKSMPPAPGAVAAPGSPGAPGAPGAPATPATPAAPAAAAAADAKGASK